MFHLLYVYMTKQKWERKQVPLCMQIEYIQIDTMYTYSMKVKILM